LRLSAWDGFIKPSASDRGECYPGGVSTIFFPLRTSVELFADRRSPEVVTRAKEAALLYDELIFEEGLYDITITDGGSTDWWLPPDHLTPEQLERSREPIPAGAPMQMVVQAQEGPGGPVTGEPHVMMQGKVGVQLVAEFHSGILDELKAFDPDWVESIATGGTGLASNHPLGRVQSQLNFQDNFDKELMPGEDQWRRDFIYKAFNRDSLVAAELDASFSITGLFGPMVERRGVKLDCAGSEALEILVPNVGALPWEAVVEWREHSGSAEARGKLREFEQRAAESEPEDATAFLTQVAREVVAGYQAAYEELLPSLPEQLQKELAKTLVSFIPVAGPFVEKGASFADIVAQAVQHRRSWVAAMMWLQARS